MAPAADLRLQLATALSEVATVPCQLDPWDFFADFPGAQLRAAQLCRPCPVRVPCRAYARALPEEWGVWGGETEWQRLGKRTRGRPRKVAVAEERWADQDAS